MAERMKAALLIAILMVAGIETAQAHPAGSCNKFVSQFEEHLADLTVAMEGIGGASRQLREGTAQGMAMKTEADALEFLIRHVGNDLPQFLKSVNKLMLQMGDTLEPAVFYMDCVRRAG